MTDVVTDVAITELLEIDPDRVDAVGSPANGTEWLILKALDADAAKADAADDTDRPDCKTCDGDGTIMAGHRKCPDCAGSGKAPKVGESAKAFMQFAAETVAAKEAGVADSGSGATPAVNCGTCNGMKVVDPGPNEKECPDCGGTGKDQATTNPSELNTVDAPTGTITEGAGGRETVDKSADITADEARELMGLDKATVSTADQNDLPDSDFAYVEPGGKKDADGKTTPRSLRHFPIMDAAHVRNALARASQSPFGDQAMPAIKAAAKKFGVDVADAEKAMDPSLGGSVFSAPNPALSDPVAQGTDPAAGGDDDSSDADAATPGSPAWEAVDAQTATDAAMALMAAAELIRTFGQREMQEVAAGEGNDIFDAGAAQAAMCGVSDALGIMAQMAFHEGLEAAKSLPEDETVEKAGRRLAGKTVAALAAARDKAKELADHIGGVLGDDDPKKKTAGDAANAVTTKAAQLSKEIENMTAEELMQLLDERDAQKAAKATEEAAPGKDVVTDATKAEAEETETEGAAKADTEIEVPETDATTDAAEKAAEVEVEMTPEQIEARKEAKAAKKALKEAKRAEKMAAEAAAMTKAIEEATEEVRKANKALEDRLATVEKMAAPTSIVRTAPKDEAIKATRRDELDLKLAATEREIRETTDADIRKARREEAAELRTAIAAL